MTGTFRIDTAFLFCCFLTILLFSFGATAPETRINFGFGGMSCQSSAEISDMHSEDNASRAGTANGVSLMADTNTFIWFGVKKGLLKGGTASRVTSSGYCPVSFFTTLRIKPQAFSICLFGGAKESKTEVAELDQNFSELGAAKENIKAPELNIQNMEILTVPPITVPVETAPLAMPEVEATILEVTIPIVAEVPEIPVPEVEMVTIPVIVEQPVIPPPEVAAVKLSVTVAKPVIPEPEVEPISIFVLWFLLPKFFGFSLQIFD